MDSKIARVACDGVAMTTSSASVQRLADIGRGAARPDGIWSIRQINGIDATSRDCGLDNFRIA